MSTLVQVCASVYFWSTAKQESVDVGGKSIEKTPWKKSLLFSKSMGPDEDPFGKDENAEYSLRG